MDQLDVDAWNGDWTWSLPLIVLTVVVHVFSLVFMNERIVPGLSGALVQRRSMTMLPVVIGIVALLATLLLALEAAAWAGVGEA